MVGMGLSVVKANQMNVKIIGRPEQYKLYRDVYLANQSESAVTGFTGLAPLPPKVALYRTSPPYGGLVLCKGTILFRSLSVEHKDIIFR
jgi:hypothetical protein